MTTKQTPPGLAELLREAAQIIGAIPAGEEPANMRFPIVDEIEGMVLMLEDKEPAQGRPAQEPIGYIWADQAYLIGSADFQASMAKEGEPFYGDPVAAKSPAVGEVEVLDGEHAIVALHNPVELGALLYGVPTSPGRIIYQARDKQGTGSWTDVTEEHYVHRGNFPELFERRTVRLLAQ